MKERKLLLDALIDGGMMNCQGCRKLTMALSYAEDLNLEKEKLARSVEDLKRKLNPQPTCPSCGLSLQAKPPRYILAPGGQEIRQRFTCERCLDENGNMRGMQ